METNWDTINLQKKNDISWQGAKRAAVDLLARRFNLTVTEDEMKKSIQEWAEWIYALEPKTLKKQYPKGRVSAPQRDYLKSLYLQKEDKEFDEDYYDNMGAFQASKEITRLKVMPTINIGDDKNGPSDNREGEKIIDYDSKTGALIP